MRKTTGSCIRVRKLPDVKYLLATNKRFGGKLEREKNIENY